MSLLFVHAYISMSTMKKRRAGVIKNQSPSFFEHYSIIILFFGNAAINAAHAARIMSTSHRFTLELSPVLAGLTVITAVCKFCFAEEFVPAFALVFITPVFAGSALPEPGFAGLTIVLSPVFVSSSDGACQDPPYRCLRR